VEWLGSVVGISLPPAEDVRGRLALAKLLRPLRTLIGGHFIGREAELQRLSAYVGVLPPTTLGEAAARGLRRVFRLSQQPPLVIHGPGGIGKSTLVARFVLQHADLGPDRRFPFAYLSFDRADLVPNQPLTLLAEAVHQLGALYPVAAGSAQEFEQRVRATLTRLSAADRERGLKTRSSAMPSSRASRDERDLLERFVSLVKRVTGPDDVPLLWVLDTFEQAQRHGPRATGRLWSFLDELQSIFPHLRVVFAGRAPIEGPTTDELQLQGFDDELALAFLRNELDGMRVSDRFLRSVVRQVQANPLSLKLAGELLRREGQRGLRDLTTRRRIAFKLSAEEIQGLLYWRILDHLDNPDLQRIANPGLVVRRVTPEVIKEVLAVPCGLGQIGPERAWELFELLRREASLVEPAGNDAVVHRADVRRTMLPLLNRLDPENVARIHRRAIRYYRRRDGVQDRTEELYHRLSLSQSTATLDEHWNAEAGAALEGVLDEFPAAGRVYLADRLDLPIEPALLAKADDEAWARQATRVARELLDDGQAAEALSLVRRRRGRTVRPAVAALEIEALAMLGRVDEAMGLVDEGLEWTTEEGRSATFVELAILGARIAEDGGRFTQAIDYLEQARSAAMATDDRILSLAAGVAQLRLYRRSGAGASSKADRLREEVIEESSTLSRRDRTRYPSLLRDLAAEIGDSVPDLILDATRLVGVDIEGDAGRKLDHLLSSDEVGNFVSFVELNASGAPSLTTPSSVQQSLIGQTATEQGWQVAEYLKQGPGFNSAWSNALKNVYQEQADKPTFDIGGLVPKGLQ
jgi:hypothetical protein